MKRAIIALTLLLIPSMATGQAFGGYYGPSVNIQYLLRCFSGTTADQTFSNAQVIDTAAEGCTEGSLTTRAAYCSSSSNYLASVGNYCMVTSTSILTRALGIALFDKYYTTSTSTGSMIGFFQNANPTDNTNDSGMQKYANSVYSRSAGDTESVLVAPMTNSTEYSFVVVLGGYLSDGSTPYYIGMNKSDYSKGDALFIKGTGFSNWTLIWKGRSGADSTLYPGSYVGNATDGGKISNILIPSYDFSAVLQPSHLSLFATDGELSAYSADVGGAGAWTEDSGDWDTASGTLVATAAGIATFDAGVSTALYDAKITTPASGTTPGGMLMKVTDTDDYWYAKITPGTAGTDFELMEVVGGSETQRMNADVDWVAATAYNVRVIASATSPYWSMFVNGVAKGTAYTTLGSGSTATKFGLKDEGNGNFWAFDVIGLWPCTSATYDFSVVGY